MTFFFFMTSQYKNGKSLVNENCLIYSFLFIEFPFVYLFIGFVVLICVALSFGKGI